MAGAGSGGFCLDWTRALPIVHVDSLDSKDFWVCWKWAIVIMRAELGRGYLGLSYKMLTPAALHHLGFVSSLYKLDPLLNRSLS